MARRERRETTPASLIATGLVLTILTGFLAGAAGFDDGDAGWAIALVGGVVSQVLLWVGIIGKGVEMGMRSQD